MKVQGENLRRILFILVAVPTLAWGTHAAGRDWNAEAAQRAAEGETHFEAGRFATALETFLAAYAVDPDPNLIHNAGACLEKLGRFGEAIERYEAFVLAQPEGSAADSLRARLAGLEKKAARTRAPVRIQSEPAGAAVFLNGGSEPAGRTPIRRWLPFGEHNVRVELAGHETVTTQVTARPGTAPTVQAALPAATSPASLVETDEAPGSDPPGFEVPWGGWVLIGVTAAALGSGVGFHVAAADHAAEARTYSQRSDASRDRWDSMVKRVQRDQLIGSVALGVAAAGAISTGLVLWLHNDGRKEIHSKIQVQPVVGESVGMALSGRF